MEFPAFTDLHAIAQKLTRSTKNGAMRKTLEQAWRAQSCLGDLRQAGDCCEILRDMLARDHKLDTGAVVTTERALFVNAISLYVRATSTSGKDGERGSIQLERGNMSVSHWQAHRLIIDTRNEALSHVRDSQNIGGHKWHRSMFFAVELEPGKWKPASASNQTSFHRPTFDALDRMVPFAHDVILKKFFKRMEAVSRTLNESGIPQSVFNECAFDPVQVFGSEQATAQLLSGHNQGTAVIWTAE